MSNGRHLLLKLPPQRSPLLESSINDLQDFLAAHFASVCHQPADSHCFHHAQKLIAVSNRHSRNVLRERGNTGMHTGANKEVAVPDNVLDLVLIVAAADPTDLARISGPESLVGLFAHG